MVFLIRGIPFKKVEQEEALPEGASLPCAVTTCRNGSAIRLRVYRQYHMCCGLIPLCRVKTSQTCIRCRTCRSRWTEQDYESKTGSVLPSSRDSLIRKQDLRFSVKVPKKPGEKLGITFAQKKGLLIIKRISPNSPIHSHLESKVASWHGTIAGGQTVVAINGRQHIATPAEAAALIANHNCDTGEPLTIVTKETTLWKTAHVKSNRHKSRNVEEQQQSLLVPQRPINEEGEEEEEHESPSLVELPTKQPGRLPREIV